MSRNEHYFEVLLERAKQAGRLPETDLKLVRNELKTGASGVDPYTLLHILGKANDRSMLDVVQGYLTFGAQDPHDDGMVRRIALQILAQWWHVRDVFPLVRKMAFEDSSPFVRAVAASSLGELGKAYPDLRRDAARALVQGIGSYAREKKEVWGSFYIGMLELAGVEPKAWPIRPGELAPDQLDAAVVDSVRRMADLA